MSANMFPLAARRSYSYFYGGSGLLALTGTASYGLYKASLTSRTDCENIATATKKTSPATLKTRMTSIGRFSLESQTEENPSVPTVFMALSGKTPLTVKEFAEIWKEREMAKRHPRFHYRISENHPGHFEPTELDVQDVNFVASHCTESIFPAVYREDLKHRMQILLLKEFPIFSHLWQMELSHGPLGTSGAISKGKAQQILKDTPSHNVESLLVFRFHHALADGVSITAALTDLCDEALEIRAYIQKELNKRKKSSLTFVQRLLKKVKLLLWFLTGSVRAMLYQFRLFWFHGRSPFDAIKAELPSVQSGRSVSWCDAAPIEQIIKVAKHFGPKTTVNDVIVACTSYAVSQQLKHHRELISSLQQEGTNKPILLSEESLEHVNVAIPVHLTGGVLLPGESMGNNIGALVARIPCTVNKGATTYANNMSESANRLEEVHKVLYDIKRTPAPLLSYMFAKFCSSTLPSGMTQRLFRNANAGASFVVSNTGRGPPTKLHLGGRPIESAGSFLPLPPGIPIGMVAASYAGTLTLSVTADAWAVPDADKFLGWFLEEYQRLCNEAKV